ncbi:hypothetical protein BDB01DRAFT_797412 [Pilobolus umbonatus]|nr:hypothetical protein BDB01DRAFT_797412 [Pilobolus umbonatus]
MLSITASKISKQCRSYKEHCISSKRKPPYFPINLQSMICYAKHRCRSPTTMHANLSDLHIHPLHGKIWEEQIRNHPEVLAIFNEAVQRHREKEMMKALRKKSRLPSIPMMLKGIPSPSMDTNPMLISRSRSIVKRTYRRASSDLSDSSGIFSRGSKERVHDNEQEAAHESNLNSDDQVVESDDDSSYHDGKYKKKRPYSNNERTKSSAPRRSRSHHTRPSRTENEHKTSTRNQHSSATNSEGNRSSNSVKSTLKKRIKEKQKLIKLMKVQLKIRKMKNIMKCLKKQNKILKVHEDLVRLKMRRFKDRNKYQ